MLKSIKDDKLFFITGLTNTVLRAAGGEVPPAYSLRDLSFGPLMRLILFP